MTETISYQHGDDPEPFASVSVKIITIPAGHPDLFRGVYFGIPPLPGDAVAPGEVYLHGPYKDAEEARSEAALFILTAAEEAAREIVAQESEQ